MIPPGLIQYLAMLLANILLGMFPWADHDDYNPPPTITEAFQDCYPCGS